MGLLLAIFTAELGAQSVRDFDDRSGHRRRLRRARLKAGAFDRIDYAVASCKPNPCVETPNAP